jgi:hypothetical protein
MNARRGNGESAFCTSLTGSSSARNPLGGSCGQIWEAARDDGSQTTVSSEGWTMRQQQQELPQACSRGSDHGTSPRPKSDWPEFRWCDMQRIDARHEYRGVRHGWVCRSSHRGEAGDVCQPDGPRAASRRSQTDVRRSPDAILTAEGIGAEPFRSLLDNEEMLRIIADSRSFADS